MKVAFFPITSRTIDQAYAFSQYHNCPTDNVTFLSYLGSGLVGQHSSLVKNDLNTGTRILLGVPENIKGCDTLVLLNDEKMLDFPAMELLIRKALYSKMTVINACNTWGEDNAVLKKIEEEYGVRLHNEDTLEMKRLEKELLKSGNRTQIHAAPVLAIGGLVEEADTFAVFTKIVTALREHDVRVSAIGKPLISNYVGMHTYPQFFQSSKLQEDEKILRMNQYIETLIQREHPQLLVIQMPGPVIRLSQTVPNGYGIKSYMLAQSTQLQGLICCVPQGYSNGHLLEELDLRVQKQYGCRILGLHFSNYSLDYQSVNGNQIYNGYYPPINQEDKNNLLLNGNHLPLVDGIVARLKLRQFSKGM